MFGLPDNAAIIRYGGVLEKRRRRQRKLRPLLDMSVSQTLTGYWMACVHAGGGGGGGMERWGG